MSDHTRPAMTLKFVKLTNVYRQRPEWVNLDLVKTMARLAAVDNDFQGRAPERTSLWFRGYGDDKEGVDVVETPEQILALGDPENACPDPPGACGYYTHYLAYGGPDLTHAGYHAACALFDRHARECRSMEMRGICQTCADGEKRIRA